MRLPLLSNIVCYICLIFILSSYLILSQTTSYHPVANLSTIWINSPENIVNSSNSDDDGIGGMSIILLRGTIGTRFICGFYCTRNISTKCFFGILITPRDRALSEEVIQFPKLAWSANRNHSVKANATLEFTQDGNLLLTDADGTFVWSSNTGGKSVAGLNLTEMGNLVLFDRKNRAVWQSFDHPTDSLVLGQKLLNGRRLTAGLSGSDSSQGIYSLAVQNGSLVASIQSNPPQIYMDVYIYDSISSTIDLGSSASDTYPQVVRLDWDGHLRVYSWSGSQWRPEQVADCFSDNPGDCGLPMACGQYGICSTARSEVQCSCFETAIGGKSYFRPIDYSQPNLGCSLTIPIDCDHYQDHFLLELENISYFDSSSNLYSQNIKLEDCKHACLKNCSCRAAIFIPEYYNGSTGSCNLLNEVFSLTLGDDKMYGSSFSVKVQNASSMGFFKRSKSRHANSIIGSILGAVLGFLLLVGACCIVLVKNKIFEKTEEVSLDQVPGMPLRFSYEDLRAVTKSFTNKLGEGGFGSVFEGTLKDGGKIAVKRLDGLGLVKKSFLAEVQTIGSIHHVNLVRLIGFCAEKSYRLLVYEYMPNRSLDKWIFRRSRENALGWLLRKKIILDVAKGLAYLHEGCRQRIIHLDIKPHNILLDKNFNAKVSDFGLSKLIDKDESHVITTMRGTLGYMAPEWLSSVITEKVDVYSFGVMVLEILCGRKNLDKSQPEEDIHLLSILKRKAEDNELLDMIDKNSEDMQLHGTEVVEIMMVAIWCLQSDFTKRPSMSDVVKVLEGTTKVASNLDYNFFNPPIRRRTVTAIDQNEDAVATPMFPSALSGPR